MSPTGIIIFLVILAVLVFLAITSYNSLISLKVKVTEAASDIDVQLKRRYDLIPNLIETVKGSSKFEQETMTAVIEARSRAMGVTGLGSDKIAAENQLQGALGKFFAVAESYPDLKSNASYLQLQQELTNTEDRILSARRFYNQVVGDYNISQDSFPTLLFKGLAKASKAPFFELENPAEERKNVQVKF